MLKKGWAAYHFKVVAMLGDEMPVICASQDLGDIAQKSAYSFWCKKSDDEC